MAQARLLKFQLFQTVLLLKFQTIFFTLISKTNVNNLQRGLRREEKPSAPRGGAEGELQGGFKLEEA